MPIRRARCGRCQAKSADNTGCCKGERRQWRMQRTEAGAAVAECEGLLPPKHDAGPQPDIIEHFGNADAVPQLPERCLSRKARIVRCCLSFLRIWEILFGGFGAACASYSRGLSVSLGSAGSFYFASGWFGRGNILDFWWVGMMDWDGFLCRVVGRIFPLRIIISHTSTP